MSRIVETWIAELAETGQDEYASGFISAYKRALNQRGQADGIAAAESAMTLDPEPEQIKKAGERYARGFIVAYEHALQKRGDQDGANAALIAPVEPIIPTSVSTSKGSRK